MEACTSLGLATLYKIFKHPVSKVHGANMGPTWVLSAPDGSHVGPMNLAIRAVQEIVIHSSMWRKIKFIKFGRLHWFSNQHWLRSWPYDTEISGDKLSTVKSHEHHTVWAVQCFAFRLNRKKILKLHTVGSLCVESTGQQWFPSQRSRNADSTCMSWRHQLLNSLGPSDAYMRR